MEVKRTRLTLRGVNEVMRSAGVVAEVARRANRVKQAAGPGYRVIVNPHRWTARAYVEPVDDATSAKDARTQKLLRALDAARD